MRKLFIGLLLLIGVTGFSQPRYVNVADSITLDSTVDVGGEIQTLIDNAIAGTTFDFTGLGGGTILINTAVELDKQLQFVGNYCTIKTTANITVLDLIAQHITLDKLKFKGSGKSSGSTNQFLVRTLNGRIVINDCHFYDAGGEAIRIQYSAAPSHGVQINNPVMFTNNIGLNTLPNFSGEYVTVINPLAGQNKTAFKLGAGNCNVTGGHIDYNDTAFSIIASANDGHGRIIGASMNHCIRAVSATSILLGMAIDNCEIYGSDIYVKNSKGVNFKNLTIRDVDIYIDNASGSFDNIMLDTVVTAPFTAPFNVNWTNSSTSYYRFKNFDQLTGLIPSVITKTGAYTITEIDRDIQANGTFTVTFPAAYKKFDTYTTVTNIGSGTVTLGVTVIINGTSTVNPTLAPGEFMVIYSDHDTYRCISKTQTGSGNGSGSTGVPIKWNSNF